MCTHYIYICVYTYSNLSILYESYILPTNTWSIRWYYLYIYIYIIHVLLVESVFLCQGSTDSRTRVKRLRERKRGISLEETRAEKVTG